MSEKIRPYFEYEGKRYTLIATRHVRAFYDDIISEKENDADFQKKASLAASKQNELLEIAEKYKAAKEEFYANPLDKDLKEKYNVFKEMYETMLAEFVKYETENGNILTNSQKSGIDGLEKVLLEALQEQYNLSYAEASDIWCNYVDEIGTENAKEFLLYMYQCFFEVEEEVDSPFIRAMRTKNQNREQMKRGLRRVRK